jgi:hypothetical protein
VQLNILDPQAKHTVRIADFGDMDETIDYINDYFGNGESSSTLDTATLKREAKTTKTLELDEPISKDEVRRIGDEIR